MNEVLTEILKSRQVGASGKKRALSAEVSAEVGDFVANIIRELKPKVSLEVGLAYGISALYICDALSEVGAKKHYLIDPNQTAEWDSIGIENLRAAGYGGLVELREQMSHVALPTLLGEGVKLDFAFIDGWHVFDQVLVDFFYIDKMLRDGGIVAFDDANWPGVRKAIRFIVKNCQYGIVGCSAAPFSRRDAIAGSLQPATRLFKNLLKPEISDPDRALGLRVGSRCIALRKNSDDTRNITFFAPF